MKHQLLEAFLKHVRVDLRGRDVGVAEELLHDAQGGAAIEQVRREGVPEHVRGDAFGIESRRFGQRLQVLAHALPCQMAFSGARRE